MNIFYLLEKRGVIFCPCLSIALLISRSVGYIRSHGQSNIVLNKLVLKDDFIDIINVTIYVLLSKDWNQCIKMQYLQKSSLILHSNRADKSFNASTYRLLNYTNQMLPFIYLRLSNFAVERTGCKTKNDHTCVWRIKTLYYQRGLTVITFITLFD